MKTVWRVFAYLKRYPWLAAGTLACAIIGTLMVIVFPSVTKWIIDDMVRANRPDKLLPLILLATFAFLIQHVFNSLRIILNNTFEQKVIFDLRSDLYSHIQLLPLRWFDNRATGDLMTRVIEDVNSVERGLIDGIEQGVGAGFWQPCGFDRQLSVGRFSRDADAYGVSLRADQPVTSAESIGAGGTCGGRTRIRYSR